MALRIVQLAASLTPCRRSRAARDRQEVGEAEPPAAASAARRASAFAARRRLNHIQMNIDDTSSMGLILAGTGSTSSRNQSLRSPPENTPADTHRRSERFLGRFVLSWLDDRPG